MKRTAAWSSRSRPQTAVVLLWGVFAYGSWVILQNSLPYFRPYGRWAPFLMERGTLAQTDLYLWTLRLHVAGGCLCLFCLIPQFSRVIRERWPAWHRRIGHLYVISVLGVVVPTGLPMAFLAKGGIPGIAGFLLLGLLMLATTVAGLVTAIRGQIGAHREWMTRSFALAASALGFRLCHGIYDFLGVAPDTNYVLSTWTSILASLALAESRIRSRRADAPPTLHPSQKETTHPRTTP